MPRQSAEVRNSTASFNALAKTVASHSDWGCGAFRCPTCCARRLSFANSACEPERVTPLAQLVY